MPDKKGGRKGALLVKLVVHTHSDSPQSVISSFVPLYIRWLVVACVVLCLLWVGVKFSLRQRAGYAKEITGGCQIDSQIRFRANR